MQISDPHVGAEWATGDPIARLEATVEAVRGLVDRPAAVVLSGDLADHGVAEEYEVVRELVARLGVPIVALPGNHDERAVLRSGFDLPGDGHRPVQYVVDVGPLRVLALDTTRPGSDAGNLDQERLLWLDARLAEEPKRPTLLAMHHPPLLTGSRAWDAIGLSAEERASFAAVLERHPQVCSIVAGHLHHAIASDLAGRVVLTSPSTYVQTRLDLNGNTIQLATAPPGYAVHVFADGRIVSHVQSVES